METAATSRKRKSPPLGKRTWTPEDENYLAEKWGYASVPAIAKKLNRTENAVVVRAQRLGLGAVLMAGGYVTLNQLLATVTGRERGNTYQRKKDYRACALQRKDPWTAAEDSRLKMLLSQHRYTWAELSEMLHRTTGAIQHRCRDLGLKDRPVKADNHGKSAVWNERDYAVLADGIRHGDSYMAIGQALGKSEKAVRGKVYTVYLTESADKVREYMGDGPWGAGAPEPKVKQAVHLSTTRTEVRKQLSYLAGLLRKRANDLGYDPYWQRFMCQNWDDFGGCSAGCANCDDCTEFRRIRPQYCARCGGTFYERKENRFCGACRTARKKKAQRHWCRVNHS